GRADGIADEPHAAPARLIEKWRDELHAAYAGRPRHPIGVALADTVARFGVPQAHFDAVVDGVEMDLSRTRYERWDGDLADYCYRVASAVRLNRVEGLRHPKPS